MLPQDAEGVVSRIHKLQEARNTKSTPDTTAEGVWLFGHCQFP